MAEHYQDFERTHVGVEATSQLASVSGARSAVHSSASTSPPQANYAGIQYPEELNPSTFSSGDFYYQRHREVNLGGAVLSPSTSAAYFTAENAKANVHAHTTSLPTYQIPRQYEVSADSGNSCQEPPYGWSSSALNSGSGQWTNAPSVNYYGSYHPYPTGGTSHRNSQTETFSGPPQSTASTHHRPSQGAKFYTSLEPEAVSAPLEAANFAAHTGSSMQPPYGQLYQYESLPASPDFATSYATTYTAPASPATMDSPSSSHLPPVASRFDMHSRPQSFFEDQTVYSSNYEGPQRSSYPPSRPQSRPMSGRSSPGQSFNSENLTATPSISSTTQRAALARSREPSLASVEQDVRASFKATPAAPKVKGGRQAMEEEGVCVHCREPIAKLILRGTESEVSVPHVLRYQCPRCYGSLVAPEAPIESPFQAKYEETLSGAVDRLQGLDIAPATPSDHVQRTFGKTIGHKRQARSLDTISCDVCNRDIAWGDIIPLQAGEVLAFATEVVCTHCCETYQRCTDCGGGGGPRLGIGKWRAKQTFNAGRRTCRFSHLRMGTMDEMSYDVWATGDLPAEHLDDFLPMAKELYLNTLLQTMAVPEVMETPSAIARTYDQALKLASDSWTLFEPYFREDVEVVQNRRRYVILRWSKPTPRKQSKQKHQANKKSASAPQDDSAPADIIRSGKTLASIVIGELDLLLGSLFIPLVLPNGIGEVYESTTLLLQKFADRVQSDLKIINAHRRAQGFPSHPPLRQAWTIVMFKRETRLLQRRGFKELEEYMGSHPQASRTDFAPIRPVFLPPELLKGWTVWVKAVAKDDEWGGGSTSSGKRSR